MPRGIPKVAATEQELKRIKAERAKAVKKLDREIEQLEKRLTQKWGNDIVKAALDSGVALEDVLAFASGAKTERKRNGKKPGPKPKARAVEPEQAEDATPEDAPAE